MNFGIKRSEGVLFDLSARLKKYRWILFIYLFALICDAISTIHFMAIDGPRAETHLVIRYASLILGGIAGPVVGMIIKALGGLLVVAFCGRYAVYILITAIFMSLWAAWYNVWGVDVYVPYFMNWIPW